MIDRERRRLLKRQALESDPVYRELHRKPAPLSVEAIIAAPPDEVEELICLEIGRRTGGSHQSEARALSSLPPRAAELFATWLLESEIMNGGFEQFFFNHQEMIWELATAAYRSFGLPEVCDILASVDRERNSGCQFRFAEDYFDSRVRDMQRRKIEFILGHAGEFALGV
jgi:hypothetical protein